jgi:hypothetical protein
MSSSKVRVPAQRGSRASRKPDQAANGHSSPEPVPRRKPMGPVIYKLEKGADVWPGHKDR